MRKCNCALLHIIADTGATSIFIMKGMPVKNLRQVDTPITISLPDGSQEIVACRGETDEMTHLGFPLQQ
jgi:hypothetical protein